MHYLVALFAAPISHELGWNLAFVQSGFSLALLVMGLTSYHIGRWIDRHGGRTVMITGCCCGAAGCALLAATRDELLFVAAWVLLGLGMRMTLYDAAFAALAHVAGVGATRAMSMVTLMGGFASTVFWPLGGFLADALGWRDALWCYALLLLASSMLHLAIPRGRELVSREEAMLPLSACRKGAAPSRTMVLYACIAVGIMVLQTGMAAHFIELLHGSGWDPSTAVALATLMGFGQFAGRAAVVFRAGYVDPVRLNLLPSTIQCTCFALYLAVGSHAVGAAAFAFLYGVGNGIATITRGAMPLVLFDPGSYGRIVGVLLKPAFALAAAAPVAFALVIEHWGHRAAAVAALGLALAILTAAVLLHQSHGRRTSL